MNGNLLVRMVVAEVVRMSRCLRDEEGTANVPVALPYLIENRFPEVISLPKFLRYLRSRAVRIY